MDKTPLISVLIPAYNREAYIEQCIRSALDQPFRDIEVIVSDNASSDRTVEIVRRIQQEDPRVCLIRQQSNIGALPNWKACLKVARGRFIHWLWSDDYVGSEFYTEWTRLTKNGEIFCAYLSAYVVFRSDNHGPVSYVKDSLSWSDVLKAYSSGNKEYLPVSPAAYILPADSVRAGLCDDIPKFGDIDCMRRAIGPDFIMILESIRSSGLLLSSNQSRAYFRSHEGSITFNNMKILHTHYMYAVNHYFMRCGIRVPHIYIVRIFYWTLKACSSGLLKQGFHMIRFSGI
jgi:glycosyltransferase involved in cell wall biosynthesis